MKYNWKPVIKDLINFLLEEGLELVAVDNECDEYDEDICKYGVPVTTVSEAVELIDSVDEAHLYVKNPDGKVRWIFVVLGNGPEEIVSDYTCDPLIETAYYETF